MLQWEIRLKEVQDATYDDMCRLLNEMKLCYTSTTLMILRLRLMVKMSCSCPIRNSLEQSSVITYLEDKDIDILISDESHRMGAKTVREKWDPIVSYCIKQGIKVVGGTATDVRADGISVTWYQGWYRLA